MKKTTTLFGLLLLLFSNMMLVSCCNENDDNPRIVNLIYFVRLLEPRHEEITIDTLYETVVEQIKQIDEYNFPATFLLQYDALILPKYQELMKTQIEKGRDVGAWWEITQPHIEKAGLEWRGRYAWDWHANVGFATGYTPQQREKIVDTYMNEFKSIFGKYPSSVGSWFIDSHTLNYMRENYGIEAVCMCRDQIGTDGYNFWGGYWNQAFYPSKYNSYMPAQTAENQIDVPVFRMLGSDPSYQYDSGIGTDCQGVITLEPVYPKAGGDTQWVEWFFNSMFEDPALGFNYVQAGQENSFTWSEMKDGLKIQIPIIAKYAKEGKIRVETLLESARWYKQKYPLSATTALSSMSDYRDEDRKTVWFNSRFYRTNLLWKGEEFFIRDIHLFDENLRSRYYDRSTEATHCIFMTLPLVDGFLWSTETNHSKIKFQYSNGGVWEDMQFAAPDVKTVEGVLDVTTDAVNSGFTLHFNFVENQLTINGCGDVEWRAILVAPKADQVTFESVEASCINAVFENHPYQIPLTTGNFGGSSIEEGVYTLPINPQEGTIVIDMSKR